MISLFLKKRRLKSPYRLPVLNTLLLPNGPARAGLFEEDGINEFNVAMSATESAYSNDLVLGFDPLVENGLNEEGMITVVLPFVKTAREGVQRLGKLIAQYGTGETNGVLFADDNEAWYFESGAGHYWVAQRIPDDAYAVAGNQLAIQEVDFNDSRNFLYHQGIQEFVEQHHLNPQPTGFNFRQIFGTADRSDAIYSTPRVWSGHQMFSARQATNETPESQSLPFIMKPDQLISVFDVQDYLGSHYQGTPYDPIGTGDMHDRHRYRPISLAKTQESHILQMNRPHGNDIHWLAMGVTAESSFVPFFADINETAAAYRRGKLPAQPNSAYWIFKHAGVLVDSDIHNLLPLLEDVQKNVNQAAIKFIEEMDQAKLNLDSNWEYYITKQNTAFAQQILRKYQQLTAELITKLTDNSPLNFNTDENL
ncbi:putative dipeptidase B [Limosilactobacillus coleohominis 101-4-CHN]|uniref:Dipeptidase n=1 Tax=Limosilactobacillus coleohominis 101-4-CHN TaxID=575594 RepID=C7XUF4_9LACO|nr:putative dipeptidase B [Limosilactobacillus coleohominis 101-4-CHN]